MRSSFVAFLRRKGAFTLIELLIVIAIIAILALIAVPNFLEAQTRAKVSKAQADMRTLATAFESYFTDYNAYPMRRAKDADTGQFFTAHDYRLYSGGVGNLNCLVSPVGYVTGVGANGPFYDPFSDKPDANSNYWYYNFLGAYKSAVDAPSDPQSAGHYPTHLIADACATLTTPFMAPAPVAFNQANANNWNPRFVHPSNWALICRGPRRAFNNACNNWLNTDLLPATSDWQRCVTGATREYDPTNGSTSLGSIFRLNSYTGK
jgi:prepilin-type N-terminal cleavage/methylation domain-containing protein